MKTVICNKYILFSKRAILNTERYISKKLAISWKSYRKLRMGFKNEKLNPKSHCDSINFISITE